MLDQLIYTRCYPQRDLKNNGQVLRKDGFGVFSMSSGLFSAGKIKNFDFLQKRLAVPNGAKETAPIGLFDSYEYEMVAPDVYMISFDVARPLCKIPRSNGRGHRTGTYIKQSFVGDIEGYPAEWFGASAWDAYRRTENEYYIDDEPNAAPPLLPQVDSSPQKGYINIDNVRDFVKDGRFEAVKAGIWFLLHEFEKNENDRKILLIKDLPKNVELWIAAMEYGFSASMARKITFTTNRSKLGPEQMDNTLFFYTDDSGRFCNMMNQSIYQTRHPYCMIVGYHPKDELCKSLRQMDTSGFVIIDGTSKTVSFQTDSSINSAYYNSVICYDSDIQDFCDVVLPSLPTNDLSGKLVEIFDAYKYLLDSDHRSDKWEYSDTIHYFNIFLQFGIPNNMALNDYIIEECMKVYEGFADKDEFNNFSLLRHMCNVSKASKRQSDVNKLVVDIIAKKIGDLKQCNNNISLTWQTFKFAGLTSFIQPLLQDIFRDTELQYYSNKFKGYDARSIETILEMFFQMLSSEKNGILCVLESNEKYLFLYHAVISLLNDETPLKRVLQRLWVVPKLFYAIFISVTEYISKYDVSKRNSWWDMVLDICGGDAFELCRKLCSVKSANIDTIEQFLLQHIKNIHGFDIETGQAFEGAIKLLGKNPDTGFQLFNQCIINSKPDEFIEIIDSIRKCKLNVPVSEKLFNVMSSGLPYDITNNVDPKIYIEIKKWGKSLNKISSSVSLYEFKQSFEKEHEIEKAVKLVYTLVKMNLKLDSNFVASNSFKEISKISAEFFNANLHIAILCMFLEDKDGIMQYYINTYLYEVISNTKSRDLVEQLLSICKATVCSFKVPGRTEEFVSNIQKLLELSFASQLENHYKLSLIDEVSKYPNCEERVKRKLIDMLKNIGKRDPHNKKIGKFFNNFFNRK